MACLTEDKIQEYIEKNLGTVENAMVRDHLIVCEDCKNKHLQLLHIETLLRDPVMMDVPVQIEKLVMKKLFSNLPTYTSIFSLVAASFIFFVTWIYVYFDFANNSLVQAFQMTTSGTSKWIGSIIQFISIVFSSVFTVFKAVNKFFAIVLNIHVGAELIGITFSIITLVLFYGLFAMVSKKIKSQSKT